LSYPIRKHFLANSQALNRKKLVENFNQAAQGLNNVRDYSIKRKTLDRGSFRVETFHEFKSNFDQQNPTLFDYFGIHPSRVIPNSVINVEAKEYGEYKISYSLELGSGEEVPPIMVHIFVNGKILGQGAQYMERDYPWYIQGGAEKRKMTPYSIAAAASVYADTIYDTTGGTNIANTARIAIEDPDAAKYVPLGLGVATEIGAREEVFSGEAVVALDEGKFTIGLIWSYSRTEATFRKEEGLMVTFHKCTMIADRRNR